MKLNTAFKFTALWLPCIGVLIPSIHHFEPEVRSVTAVPTKDYANINLDTFRLNLRVSNV
jgi:hypothetical protein